MWLVPNRVGAAVLGAAAIGVGVVSLVRDGSEPPRLPDPVILQQPVVGVGQPGPASTGSAEPVRPCVAEDDSDDHDDDDADDLDDADPDDDADDLDDADDRDDHDDMGSADSADSADSPDCDCDDVDDDCD